MEDIELVSRYGFGNDLCIPEIEWSAELAELEMVGLDQLKTSLIKLLESDRQLQRIITDIVMNNPYVAKVYDGGCNDVDFL